MRLRSLTPPPNVRVTNHRLFDSSNPRISLKDRPSAVFFLSSSPPARWGVPSLVARVPCLVGASCRPLPAGAPSRFCGFSVRDSRFFVRADSASSETDASRVAPNPTFPKAGALLFLRKPVCAPRTSCRRWLSRNQAPLSSAMLKLAQSAKLRNSGRRAPLLKHSFGIVLSPEVRAARALAGHKGKRGHLRWRKYRVIAKRAGKINLWNL